MQQLVLTRKFFNLNYQSRDLDLFWTYLLVRQYVHHIIKCSTISFNTFLCMTLILLIYLLNYFIKQRPSKKQRDSQPVSKFPAFHGNRKFIKATSPCLEPEQSSPYPPSLFSKIHFYINLHLHLGLSSILLPLVSPI